ncbi:hypothetical protein HYALB_00013072 [Hymenoscyphus albidus]|uniref:Rhodopsin domain-containing protein n=1 Tax=Hymenoscyphus albidus TaxID=595503 RepID=A0A9N9LYI0_9HELO|nr:hypothetical protein HYALB_00013072 [Hymenoscyphus albidus]
MSTSSGIPDYGPLLTHISYGFLIPTTLIYFWRIASRFSLRDSRFGYHWDDFFLTCCWVFAVTGLAFGLISVRYGFGKHMKSIPISDRPHAFTSGSIKLNISSVKVMFAKLVVLSFYCRVFRADNGFYIRTLCLIAVIIAATIGFVVANIMMCTPIARVWDRSVPGTCINNEAYWVSHAVFHILTDVIIFFMPVLPVMRLNMDTRKKIAVIGAFTLGSIVCIADGVRIQYLRISANSGTDTTYGAGPAVILTTIVSLTSIMCLCLVTGLRRSIIVCCRSIRQTSNSRRPSLPLTDVEAAQGTRPRKEAWQHRSQTIIRKTESEESIVMANEKPGRHSTVIVKNVSYSVQSSEA